MRARSRFFMAMLGLLGTLAWMGMRERRGKRAPRPDGAVLLASVAGEEDPGAAVDSPAPPRPFRGA